MTIEEQIAELESENARLRDEQISRLQAQISVLQARLDQLWDAKIAEVEAVNQSLRGMMQSRRRRSPLKGRKVLEDYECAVSTFIKRQGGIKISKDLREEFGGWNRLHDDKALPVDEMAEAAWEHGLIPEPTTNALIDGRKAGRGSAREPSRRAYEMDCEQEVRRREAEPCPF
jgi:hypothetical protein